MKTATILATALLVLAASPAMPAERLPPVPAASYNDEQRQAAADFEAARKTPVFGPFEVLMHSPQLLTSSRAMGDYLRYHAAIGNRLGEFAILITAREWTQDYEWHVHRPIALKAGIRPEVVEAIADGRRPEGMQEEEDIVYDFATELHRNHRVSDRTFDRAEKKFGRKGIVDLTGIAGYYTLLAMQLNVARYPVPAEGARLPRFPESHE